MASQDGIFAFKGKLDEVIGYNRKGKRCYRRLPKHVRRSIATQLAASDFGTASKAGKLIRLGIKQALDIRTDYLLTNRLNKSLLEVLYAGRQQRGNRSIQREQLPMITGFQFNPTTSLKRLLASTPKVVPDEKGNLRIVLPELTIPRNAKATHVEIKAIAAGVNFNEGSYQQAVSDKVLIDLRKPITAKELVLPFTAGKDETVVVLQVRAFTEMDGKLYLVDNLKYFAADIIDVIPSLSEETSAVFNSQAEKQPLFQLHGDNTYAAPQRE